MTMSLQAIYNKARKHLLAQNEKSVDGDLDAEDGEVCKYRGQRGLMCAAGVFIPNDLYTAEMENRTVDTQIVAEALVQAGVISALPTYDAYGNFCAPVCPELGLLGRLQKIHDLSETYQWAERLDGIAREYDLTIEPATLTRDEFELAYRRTMDAGGNSYDASDIESSWRVYHTNPQGHWLSQAID